MSPDVSERDPLSPLARRLVEQLQEPFSVPNAPATQLDSITLNIRDIRIRISSNVPGTIELMRTAYVHESEKSTSPNVEIKILACSEANADFSMASPYRRILAKRSGEYKILA
ncbi:MAG: hypothetical protein AAFX96_09970, partial [Pseudomonadota bacterium]